MAAMAGRESLLAPGAGLLKDDSSSRGHVGSCCYGTQVSRGYECPQGGGCHVRQLMTGRESSVPESSPREPVGQ